MSEALEPNHRNMKSNIEKEVLKSKQTEIDSQIKRWEQLPSAIRFEDIVLSVSKNLKNAELVC